MKSFTKDGTFAVSPEGYRGSGQGTPPQKREHGHRTTGGKLGREVAHTAVGPDLDTRRRERRGRITFTRGLVDYGEQSFRRDIRIQKTLRQRQDTIISVFCDSYGGGWEDQA